MTKDSCPLSRQNSMYWQSDTKDRGFPEICQEICEGIWEQAIATQKPEIDQFEDGCTSMNTEYGDMSLQGSTDVSSSRRFVGILTLCAAHDVEAFSETYTFECPNG